MRRAESAFAKTGRRAKLVDMETGQFYFFCDAFRGERPLEYLAVKGAANSQTDVHAQMSNSAAVLLRAVSIAAQLLGIDGSGVSGV